MSSVKKISRGRCSARVSVAKGQFNLVLAGVPTRADVILLAAEAGWLADRLESEVKAAAESAQGVPVQVAQPRHPGEVIYGRFQRIERSDLSPTARAVNAAP